MSYHAWCIESPDGELYLGTLTFWRSMAIEHVLDGNMSWKQMYRRGYRAVKVTVCDGWLVGLTTEQALDRLNEICDLRRENDELREQLQLEREKVRQLSELVQHRIGHAIDSEIGEEPGGAEI